MKKYVPRRGKIFKNRQELMDILIESGWEWEGQDTGFDDGKVISYNVGVRDEENDTWLMIDLVPVAEAVRVTKVRKLRISDYAKK